MWTGLGVLAVGIALLVVGGSALVRGASALARAAGISPMVVGLTVVAFGTSAPELVVNLLATASGNSGVAFGNVVGSNLANIGLILGIGALMCPLPVAGTLLLREIPLLLLATLAALILAADGVLRSEPAVLDRSDGLVLLLFFVVFLYAMVGDVLRQRARGGVLDPLVEEAEQSPWSGRGPTNGLGWATVLTAVGLVGLLAGGKLTVDAATELARALAVPEVVVGLLLVAVGTSLPELVTTVVAVRRGETDIAIGNVVGSNLFNLLFVLGTSATVRPVEVPAGGLEDLAVTLVTSVLLMAFAFSHGRRLVRWEGGALLTLWLTFAALRALT